MRCSTTLAVLLALVATTRAHAYRTAADVLDVSGPVRWESSRVSYVLVGSLPAGLDVVRVRSAVRAAARTWSEPSCADVELVDVALSSGPAVAGDGVSTIAFIQDSWEQRGLDPSAAATTDVVFASRGDEVVIREADILLNAVDYDWAVDSPSVFVRDVQAVVAHELGHLLGLAHPCELGGMGGAPACDASHRTALMHPVYAGSRTTDADDEAGLCALYPTSACVTCSLACELDVDCASGRCDLGECVPVSPSVGDPCLESSDCASRLCNSDGYCTVSCTDATACPDGWHCDRDGRCSQVGEAYGATCRSGNDCASRLCLVDVDGGTCTRPCDEGCPAGDECALVDDRAVCRAPAVEEQGCAAGGTPSAPSVAFVTLILVATRRSRASCRSRRTP